MFTKKKPKKLSLKQNKMEETIRTKKALVTGSRIFFEKTLCKITSNTKRHVIEVNE